MGRAAYLVGLVVVALSLAVGYVVGDSSSDDSNSVGSGEVSSGNVLPARATGAAGSNPREFDSVVKREDELEQQASAGAPAVFSSDNTSGDASNQATEQYLAAVLRHADTIWSSWFRQNGYAEPRVGYQIIATGQSYTTSCETGGDQTFASDHPNAYYCGVDPNQFGDGGVVILPVDTFKKMWTGDIFGRQIGSLKRVGDFAAAAVVAHEFGHHVQDELASQTKTPAPQNPNKELIADCFAGVWAYSTFLDGYLEEGDIEEALGALDAVGDDLAGHGSSAQRQNAFLVGYEGTRAAPGGGVPARCIENYWPA